MNEDLGSPSKNTASASVGDPLLTLSKFSTCEQDVSDLSFLNTNVIRSYAIDPAEPHSDCMASLASASIFVLIDLTAPGYIIDGSNPQWTEELYNRYTAVIDAMHVFNNTFGFLVGDDIAGPPNKISPFIRAAVRDMKNYMASKGYRNIPVGYAASDNGSTHGIAQYLACGDPSKAVDFLGINNRGWCEPDNYDTSGYRAMTSAYSLYPVPTFLAAYGCLSSDPGATEDFSEIAYIYCSMLPVISGGFFYDFFSVNESSQYGKPPLRRVWKRGINGDSGLVTTDGHENLKADNSSWFHLYNILMGSLQWPYSCISSAYVPPNPFPTSCPADAVASLPPVPVLTASNVTSPRNPNSPPSPSHLSHAVTAGIAVGCVLATSFLVTSSCIVIHRKRRRSAHAELWSKGELPADDVADKTRALGPHMVDSTAIAELEDAQRMPEVEGRSTARELEGGSTEIFEAAADLSALPELLATEH